MPSASAAGPAARPRIALRALLLGGAAGVAMLSAAEGAGASNILPTQGAINLTTAGAGKLATKVLSGGGVAAGSVNYTSTGPSATLTLPSQRTLIDWTTFRVGSTNSLTFDFMSSANAVVLNRVPVGASIVIDSGGTVSGQYHGATGGNIWFLADGGVFIHGKVTASGVLATNNSFGLADLDLLNDNIGALKTNLAAASGLIDLSGTVVASGAEVDSRTGNIILTGELDASAAGATSAGAINIASPGAVTLSGALDATSKSGVGGAITVTGQSVTLAGASLDASGALGGGTIRVGGDAHGGGTLAQASATSIDAASTIAADATARGDGGSVVVWSTEQTTFAGQISARGAGAGGQGGAAEVSSHNLLTYTGFTNLTAPSGRTGVLLLDPTDLTIASTATTNVSTTGTNPVTNTPTASPSVLQNTTLNTQLAGASVIVTTVGSPDSPGEHGDITVSAPVTWSTANTLTLNAAGSITIDAAITGSSAASVLALNSAGTITQTAAIAVGTLTGSSSGGASFDDASNAIAKFQSFTNTTSGDVVLADGVNLTANTIADTVGSVNLSSTGSLSITGAALAPGVDLILSAGTSLSQANAPTVVGSYSITAASFDPNSLSPTFSPGQDFTVAALASLTLTTDLTATRNLKVTSTGTLTTTAATLTATGGTLTLQGATGLTVGATVATAGASTFSTTTSGTISLQGPVNATGRTLTLTSAGTIAANGATITAGTLTGSSAGGASFDNTSNAIGTFGPFSDSSDGDVTLADGRALTVTGVVSLGTGTLTLTSTGAISGDGATITAGTLTGSSSGGASFDDASNAIAKFQNFTNTTSGDVVLADGVDLSANTIADTVGSVNLSSTGSLSVTGAALDPGVDLTLTAGTSLSQANAPTVVGSYSITAASFDANSLNPTFSPGQDFTVAALASLTLTTDLTATRNLKVTSTGTLDTTAATLTATGGTLTLQGATGLNVGATVATAGASTFSTTTSGTISLQGPVNAAGRTLTLTSAGTISQNATGIIKASTLTGSSVGGTTLGDTTNQIGTFGGFTDSADGSVDVGDSLALTVTGVVSLGTGTLTLTSSGTISGNGATITAGTLTGSSSGGATFNDTSNTIGTFGPFSDAADGNVTLADGEGLTVTGAVSLGTGTLTLTSTGAISGNGATITAGTLTGSSAGGASFNDASNAIATFGAFSDTSNGNVTLADGRALTVTGAVSIGTGTLTLTSTGAISGDGATITAGTLTGSSVGGASFDNASNAIGTFGLFSDTADGNVTLADGEGLTVTGAVSLGTGTLTLTSTGAISGDGATITAGTLTGSSVGGASFNNTANHIGAFQDFTNTTSGDVVLADGVNLTANTIADTVGSVNLSSTGSLSITGAALAPGVDLILSAGTSLSQANAPTVVGSYSITAASFDPNSLSPTFSPGQDFTVAALASLTLTTDLTATRNLKVTSTGTLTTTAATLTATGGTLTLQGATGLTVGATVATAGASTFSTTTSGTISLQGPVNATGRTLTLTSAGTIAANGATITAGTLTGSSAGGASFDNTSNAIGTFGPFSDSSDGDVTLADGRALTVTGVVSLGTGTLTLTSTGAISGDGATITAGTLTGSSSGGASFDDASNAIAKFQNFTNTTSGDVVLADGVDLSANTIADTVGSVNLSSTGSLSVTGAALDPGVDLTLTAGTSLSQANAPTVVGSYSITAASFDANSLNPTFSPGQDFTVAALASLTLTTDLTATRNLKVTSTGTLDTTAATLTATGGTLTLQGATGLNVGATVATAGASTFSTTTSGTISLQGPVNAAGRTLTLTSAGTIAATGATITAGTLTGSSAGGASFDNTSNAIGTFGPFSDSSDGNVTLADGRALAVTGVVSLGTGTLTLTSSGAISANGATITAGTLSGSSVGGASFNDTANHIGAFQDFTNTTSGDVVLADGVNLTANTIADSVGSLNLSSTGFLHVTGPALDAGVDLILSAGTGLTQANAPTVVRDYSITAASFDTNSLNPAFTPGHDFTVDALGSFTLTTDLTATRDLKVTSTGTLDTTGATLTATGGTLTLEGATGLSIGATVATSGSSMFSTTTSGTISLEGPVNAAGQTVTVTSLGTIAATGATITAGTLTGSSAGGASFDNTSNAIGTLGPFSNTGAGAITVADGEALTVTGAVSIGTGTLTLTSAGAISADGATITAGTLAGSSAGGASFGNTSNAIGTFGPFNDTANGGVTLADSRALTVSGVVSLGTGTLSLTSTGAISGNGATITAGTLTGSSVGGASFDNASNAIGTFGSFSNTGGGVTVADAEGLTVTGVVSIGTGTLTLTSAGAISADGATITAGTLAGSSAGGASFDNTSNAIGTFGPFADTAGGNVTLTDGEALTVTGAVSVGAGTLTLTSTGAISGNGATITAGRLTGSSAGGASFDNTSNAIGTFGSFNDTANGDVTVADGEALTVTGAVSLGTGTLTLASTGSIAADGATITAGTLTGSSVGGASFNDTSNAINTFGPFADTSNGNIILADGRNLVVTGAVSVGTGTLTLTSTGTIAANGATITAGTLTGSSVGGASFNDTSNAITTFGPFADTANGDVTVADGRNLTVAGAISLGTGTLTLTSTGSLAANGATITAASLTGSSVGGASFNDAANAIGAFGAFSNTGGGAVTVADGENLTVTGAVSIGSGVLTLTSTGVISADGATITAGTLTGSSAGGASFNDSANAIATFGPFSDTASGNVTLADGRALSVTGVVSNGTGVLTLRSAGAISANGATITTGMLTGSSVGGASFNDVSNAITTFGPFGNTGGGAVAVADGQNLVVTGAVSVGAGTLTLTSTGTITAAAATITAGTLTGSSVGGASFNDASNAIATFGSFADTANGAVTLADGRALTVTGAVSNGAGVLTLTSTGAISGNGATITTGTLTGSSAGGASFDNTSNAIATFGAFSDTANGAITVADGQNLTVTGAISIGTGTLTLASAGTISADSATLAVGTLTGSSVGGASFNDSANAIGTFGPFADTGAGNVTLADGQSLTVAGAVSLGTGTLTLTSAGTITAAAATITAGILTGSSVGGASFNDTSNAIATFGPFADTAGGNVTLADGRNLTVTGAVDVGGGTLTLISTGSIGGNGATITAATLAGSSVSGASFDDVSNAIGTLGPFSNTGGGGVSLADGQNLTVTGAVSLGAGTLTLTSTGTIAAAGATITAGTLTGSSVGGASFNDRSNAIATFGAFADTAGGNVTLADGRNLTVTGAVNVGTGTLTLVSTGTIAGNGATITAATLTGSSVGGASFNDASNAIGTLGPFADTANGAVTLADGQNLVVTGTVSLGTGTLTLTSAGTITAAAATITAGTLTGSSVGGASFNDTSNAIATFGSFNDTANGDVTLADGRALTVTGAVSNGAGVLTLTSTGAISANGATITTGTVTGSSVGGTSFNDASNAIGTFGPFADTANGAVTVADGRNLVVTGAVSLGTGTLSLISAGTIAADSATITAGTLRGSSVGGASFNDAANAIGAFGPFADTANGAVTLADGQNLAVTGAVSLGTGTLTLSSAGTIAAAAAAITAGTLTGSSVGGASFNDASNAIATFGAFSDTSNGNVTLADGRALTVTGAVSIGTGTLTLTSASTIAADTAAITAGTLTGSSVGGATFNDASNAIGTFGSFADTRNGAVTLADGQHLVVAGAVSLGTGTLTLTSAGSIVADTATITAGTLTGSSVGGASFNDASNAITTFGAFSDTANGNVTLADGRALSVTGAVGNGTGVLTLTSTGVISANAATITTGTLTGSSVGGASFNDASNAIATFGPFADTANGAATLADGQSLTVTGAVNLGTGRLTLTSAGTITAAAATITAGTLTGSSVGGASFSDSANAIATFGAFADTAGGNVTLADGRALTVTGAVSDGTGVLTLTSTGVISANGATITTGTLTGSSAGGASFDNPSNAIATLGPFADTAGGNITLADGQNLTVTGAVSLGAGILTLTSTGAIAADSATITAGTLKGSSVGGASFNDAANAITTFGPFADTAGGNVTLADRQSLTVTGAVSIGTGTLTLTSAGTISANAATLTVGTLTGASAGGASFNDASNAIGTFGPFSDTANGAVILADGRALTVTGAVNIGTGTLTLASAASIAADSATITAGTLTGSSTGGASFNNASNAVGTFGPYRDTANGDVTLADGRGLTVSGAVSVGTGTLTLTSAGPIAGNGATIIAGALTGSSVGGASFGGPNLFAGLAGFTNAGGGNVAITDARAGGLTVTAAVAAGAGDTLTLTTTNGGPLTLAASLSATGGTVDLVSAGAIDQTGGVITAATLAGSSVGLVSLGDANQLANLGGFSSAGAGDFAFTDAAASGLTVTADIAVVAGRTVTLTTTGGPLTLGANITASGGGVTLASSGVIDQTAGVITAGTLTGASTGGASLTDGNLAQTLSGFVNRDSGAITLVNNAALAVTGTVDNTTGMAGGAGRDISVTLTSGSLTGAGVFTAARDVALHTDAGSLSFASATAGDDLVLRAATGVAVTGALAATGSASPGDIADPAGAGKILAAGSPIGLFGQTYAVLTDGSHVDVQTARGDIALGGVASAAGDVRLQALAGAIHSSDIDAGRTIILDAATTVDRSGAPSNNLSAGVDVAVQAGSGPVDVGAVVATGGDVVARSVDGAVTLASASAGDTLLLRAATAVTVQGGLASGTGSDGMSLAGAFLASQPGQALTAFGHTYASLAGGAPIDIVASTVAVGGPMTANGSGSDVRVVATGADVGTTPALALQGAISAGQDVALDATGGDFSRSVNGSIVVGGAIAAGRDVAARATSGSITLASASAGDDVVLVAAGGSVNLNGSVTATGSATQGIGETLFETVNSVLDGLFTLGAQSIYVDAISFANTGYGGDHPASLTAGTGVGMSLADTTGLVLADAKPAAGSWVMASTLAAPTVSLFESKGNIIVGGATVNSPVTKVNLYTSDLVMVTGLLAPATDNTANVTVGDPVQAVWTPSQIDIVNDGGTGPDTGAIGFTSVTGGVYSTSPRTFSTVSLYAVNDILLGTQAFITANAAVTDIGQIKQIDPSRPVPIAQANMSQAVMLAAGDLTLASGSLIVQQNTSGLRTTNGSGYYVTGTLTLGAYGPFPPAIDLFGVFVKPGTTIPITGPAAADVTQIFLMPDLVGSPYRGLYRVNSCIIGELGNCTPTTDGIINIPLDELSKGSLLSRDELDVEDPTITGAPNEEIWRQPDDNK
jgi:hypothetical protein